MSAFMTDRAVFALTIVRMEAVPNMSPAMVKWVKIPGRGYLLPTF